MIKINPIILSGGSGTRLWPLSRKCFPKQFLSFFNKNTLFQNTLLRVAYDKLFHKPVVVCNNEHRFMAANDLARININPDSIILEPISRNTTPAITAAALNIIQNRDLDDDLMLVMPSDHLIANNEQFLKNIQQAIPAAQNGYLVTFGIIPNSPETGYGYIKKDQQLDWQNIYKVEQFVEKPDLKSAQNYIESGQYFWNSGIFLFKANKFIAELNKFEPDIIHFCKKSYNQAIFDLDFTRLDAENFASCQNISVDYALMEKSSQVVICPIDVGWSDIGSWTSISDHSPKDENNNNLQGDVSVIDTSNCYISSKNTLVATIGIENLIIIALKDVILVANKNSAQDVKKLYNKLLEEKREECQNHVKAFRPWGSYEQIDIGDRFKVKRINVKPGAALSLQTHKYRAEHWVVVKGEAFVTNNDQQFILNEDQSTYIPVGVKHRLENRGKSDLEIIEVQTGKYLGEDDIVRFSDIYGR